MDWILAIIKAVRKSKGLSQEQLADLLGIDQKTYGNWETGRTDLTFKNLERIAQALDMPVSDLWDAAKFEGKVPESVKRNSEESEPDLYRDLLKAKDDLIEQLKEKVVMLNQQIAELKSKKV